MYSMLGLKDKQYKNSSDTQNIFEDFIATSTSTVFQKFVYIVQEWSKKKTVESVMKGHKIRPL